MSERNKLEQVLELLLAEDNERAEELLHEYVVETARAEYERILDEDDEVVETEETDEEAVEESEESDEEAVEEAIDDSDPEADFVSDVEDTDAGIDADEIGAFGGDDEEEASEEDLEDKVDSLEDELEDLRAEFEKLLSGEEDGEGEEELPVDMDVITDIEQPEEESIEYDLDEEVADEDEEVVEEATKLSDNVAAPKGGAGDAEGESPLTKKPSETIVTGAGDPVKVNDGGDGNKGDSAKDHTPSDNIKVEPKKA